MLTAGGMIQNTGVAQQMILPQQQQQPRAISLCQVNQAQPLNLGQVGSQLQFGQPVNLGPVNPTLNFGQAGQPLALGQVNQTLNLSQVNQVIGTPGQIRFTAMPTNFGFNTAGQIVGGSQTLLNFQVMLQPLYIGYLGLRFCQTGFWQLMPGLALKAVDVCVCDVSRCNRIRDMLKYCCRCWLSTHQINTFRNSFLNTTHIVYNLCFSFNEHLPLFDQIHA